MSNKKKHTLVPDIRFPEFRDSEEWEEKTIGELCKSFSGGTPATTQKLYYGGNIPFIRSAEIDKVSTELFLTKEGIENSSAKLVEVGDVLVALYGANSGDVAISKISGAINQAILCLKSEESNVFIYQFLLLRKNWIVSNYIQGGQGNLSGEIVRSIKIEVPSSAEQQKIASCLSSLDELLAAETQKLEALKAHKKGMMQNLFPTAGATTPAYRFPEFKNSGHWQAAQIGGKVNSLSGYPFSSTEISDDTSGIPLMRGINITEGFVRHSADIDRYFLGDVKGLEKYRLLKNDLIIGMDGSKVGKNSALVTDTDSGSLLIQRVARLRAENESIIQFVFQQINSTRFHSYVARINTSGGIPHISLKQIEHFQIAFPKSNKEIEKIADCLSAIDRLITAQVAKIEQLRQHKKGLMQGLFPNVKNIA